VLELTDGVIADAAIAVMSAGLTAVRADEAADALIGQQPTDELFATAAAGIDSVIDPLDDVHGPADYKRNLAKVVTRRALQVARSRATGASG
jgi:carbon-monoxide dehydrogenase medium subunit